MRIIGGRLRGRRIYSTRQPWLRPTSDRVKGAIFNILGECVQESRVLDLFAGSGNLGIEALSRGARKATFVDSHRQAAALIERNLQSLGLVKQAEVVREDIFQFLRRCDQKFDLIFADPPYEGDIAPKTIIAIGERAVLAEHGVLIVEHSSRETLAVRGAKVIQIDRRTFGDTAVSFYKWEAKP